MVLGVSRSSLERYLACPYSFVVQYVPELHEVFKARVKRTVRTVASQREGLEFQRRLADLLVQRREEKFRDVPDPVAKLARVVQSVVGRVRRVYRRSTAWIPGFGGYGLPDIVVEGGDGRVWVVEVKRSRVSGWRLRLQLEWYLYSAVNNGLWVLDGREWVRIPSSDVHGVILVQWPRGSAPRVEKLVDRATMLVTSDNLGKLLVAKRLAEDYVVYDVVKKMKECRRCPYKMVCRLFVEKGLVEKQASLEARPVGVAWARTLLDYHGLEHEDVASIPHAGEGRDGARLLEAVEESIKRPCGELEESLEKFSYVNVEDVRRMLWQRVSEHHLAP